MSSDPQIPETWKNILNESQIEAVTTINGPFLIMAGAGSGSSSVCRACRALHYKDFSYTTGESPG